MPVLHIGFDDTDSREGMCTTYLAYRIVKFLLKHNTWFVDYPLLIRLNPNIPWKTRGNGAVALRVKVEVDEVNEVIDGVRHLIENNSHIGSGANPGLAVYSGEVIPDELKEFASRALYDVLSRKKALELARNHGIQTHILGNGQGIVGAMAAIGALLDSDHTFEIIAYRKLENCGAPRKISKEAVLTMSEQTYPNTFNNYDYKHDRVLITPRGPDPIFCGIRGEESDILLSAFLMLDIQEPLDGYVIFRTNHGTNMHLTHQFDLSELKTYTAGYVRGRLSCHPYTIKGGHTFFQLENEQGSTLCAVYEPTGQSQLAQRLIAGDLVEIGGGVRKATSKHPKVLNMEYLKILHAARKFTYSNPLCKNCNKRLKSEGKNKGFQCEGCGNKEKHAQKISIEAQRAIGTGLHIAVPKAHRHLTKPLQRYGREKSGYNGIVRPNWYCKFILDVKHFEIKFMDSSGGWTFPRASLPS